MPLDTLRDTVLFGYRILSKTGMALSGKNYRLQHTKSYPAVERRKKPADVSEYSLSNTSRTYFHEAYQTSDMAWKPIPDGREYIPAAYIGGIGSYGLQLTAPPNMETKLLLAVKNQTANLAITLAQYRQLATVWGSFAQQVLTAGAKLQRIRNPKNFARMIKSKRVMPGVSSTLSSASGAYLGYLFGVQQAFDDFSAVRAALRRRFEDPIYITLFPKSYHQRTEKLYTGNNGNGRYEALRIELRSDRVKGRFRVFPNDHVMAQLGMTNLPAAIWDFVPFSFVINQIIPIGQYLATLDALHGVSDLRWYYTWKTVEEVHGRYPDWGNATAKMRQESIGRGRVSSSAKAPLPKFAPSKFAQAIVTDIALLSVLREDKRVGRAILRLRP